MCDNKSTHDNNEEVEYCHHCGPTYDGTREYSRTCYNCGNDTWDPLSYNVPESVKRKARENRS
jgi:protein-arginine kinase activator protein McsA